MSKVEELRKKYASITATTFNRFVEGDKTSTKKYLEYMLKSWENRAKNFCPSTSLALIKLVNEFDKLLPFIQNKDIYDKEYSDISLLRVVITRAEEIREEKTFNRDEHVLVLDETDEYLFIQPKTHRGSLKYGAGTRWCTASRGNPNVFENHKKSGCLVYLIDKKGDKGKNYHKVAFYFRSGGGYFSDSFEIYNANDSRVREGAVIGGNWKQETMMRLSFIFRSFASEWHKTKTAIQEIDKVKSILGEIDFDSLSESMKVVENSSYSDYISNVQKDIDKFIKNLKNFQNARFTTTEN